MIRKFKFILPTIIFVSKLYALDFSLISKVKIPSDYKISEDEFRWSILNTKSDSSIIWWTQNQETREVLIVAISSDRNVFTKNFKQYHSEKSTNLLSSTIENGGLVITKQEIEKTYYTNVNIPYMLRSISTNGFILIEDVSEYKKTTVSKVDTNPFPTYLSSIESSEYSTIISKISSNGKFLSNVKIEKRNVTHPANSPGFNYTPINECRNYIFCELKDDYLYFYILTDSDLLSSPNRITLGSSQNGSLTATVNNPEQALLNIQSSTNLIDWNTFKTIKNEPSLEVVIPANKPKEFIRAVE
jgi:hypothetical protein